MSPGWKISRLCLTNLLCYQGRIFSCLALILSRYVSSYLRSLKCHRSLLSIASTWIFQGLYGITRKYCIGPRNEIVSYMCSALFLRIFYWIIIWLFSWILFVTPRRKDERVFTIWCEFIFHITLWSCNRGDNMNDNIRNSASTVSNSLVDGKSNNNQSYLRSMSEQW